ncbi:hypothetical protein [Plantactinospora sp. BB1]|uniref:baeRF3 domain-containing protein n=1 Tax=Plantactinospora sp. BB1 TaxID=2071627 RepID=UPI000D15BB6B|nr:hypothetical protein [Plantactinospora sp. BB1]AVT37797.1 hypothetical protein C6W10_16520 [Plantactinospora sp. BB1]
MDLLTAPDLAELASSRGGLRISLYVPTQRGGPATARNRIRLRNLLRHTERVLRADGIGVGRLDAVLGPAWQLLDPPRSWDQPSDGLAVFLGPDEVRQLRVPLRLPELVTVGDRFVVRPLLPLLSASGRFCVLTLTHDEIRLFEGTRRGLDEVALEGLPLAVWLTMPRPQQHAHAFLAGGAGAGGGTLFHDGGDQETTQRVLQHFQRVDQALGDLCHQGQVPLVLAGVRSLQALYRRANTYPRLLPTGVDGSPRGMPVDVLHRLSWALVEPMLRRDEAAAAATYRRLRGTGRTTVDPREVLTAAQQGRVEALFLSTDAPGHATGVDAGPLVRLAETLQPADELDLAWVATLRHRGEVHALAPSRMPERGPVAATRRD